MSRCRTLVIVEGIVPGGKALAIQMITWKSGTDQQEAQVPLRQVSMEISMRAARGPFPFWLSCWMESSARTAEQLDLTDFEFAPEPDPNDGLG